MQKKEENQILQNHSKIYRFKMPMISTDHEQMIALHGEHKENVEVHVVHDVIEVDGNHDETHEVKIVKKVEVVSD